jgi:hypothetical protein
MQPSITNTVVKETINEYRNTNVLKKTAEVEFEVPLQCSDDQHLPP